MWLHIFCTHGSLQSHWLYTLKSNSRHMINYNISNNISNHNRNVECVNVTFIKCISCSKVKPTTKVSSRVLSSLSIWWFLPGFCSVSYVTAGKQTVHVQGGWNLLWCQKPCPCIFLVNWRSEICDKLHPMICCADFNHLLKCLFNREKSHGV